MRRALAAPIDGVTADQTRGDFMGFGKRKTALFCTVSIILFLECFLPEKDIFGKGREQYTSVTVEFRDADTGGVFDTYVHPWQRVGKPYTYCTEELIYQEGRGLYCYDEAHKGTISEITALSKNAGENQIILYYKRYEMEKDQYAVTVTFKDADMDEVIYTEIKLFERQAFTSIFCEGWYAYDMDYCITGENGETYLYDIENQQNIPVTKVEKNAVKNEIVLYYKKGQIKEGEAIAEVHYKEVNKLLKKSFVAGLSVGESYQCSDESDLCSGWRDGDTLYYIWKPRCSFEIEALSANPRENIIKLEYIVDKPIGGLPIFFYVPVRYVEEATGNVLAEEEYNAWHEVYSFGSKETHQKDVSALVGWWYDSNNNMFYYRPQEILHLANGSYYFDNTCPDHVLQVNGEDYYTLQSGARKAKGAIVLYYRADKKPGDKACVYVDYLDAATGRKFQTAELSGMEVGKAYSHMPEASFDSRGKRYLFDKNNAGNVLHLGAVCGQPDMDRIRLYYKGTDLPEPKKNKVKVGRVSLDKPKNAGRKMKLSWKKVSGADGYQVVYAYNKKFKKAIKKTTVKSKFTLKKLKKGSVCYVKVRAYKLDSAGQKIYGKYSKKKKVTIC